MASSLRLLTSPASDAERSTARPSPFGEPALFYDPPYATPLDDAVAWHLVKYLAPACSLQSCVPFPEADRPDLRADFVIEHPATSVALMLTDGAIGERDRRRDAVWVGRNAADAVVRFQVPDVAYRLHDALWLWTQWMPDLFSERGRINLSTLASPVARQQSARPDAQGTVTLHYGPDPATTCALLDVDAPDRPDDTLTAHCFRRPHPEVWQSDHQRALRTVPSGSGSSARPRRLARSA